MRVAPAIERRRCVARRGGEPVTELVHDDDEVLRRVERLALGDRPLEVVMLRPVGGRIDDDVRLGSIERAMSLVGEACVPVGQPRLEHDIAGLKDLVIWHGDSGPAQIFSAISPRGRSCPGHPRLFLPPTRTVSTAWVAGSSPATGLPILGTVGGCRGARSRAQHTAGGGAGHGAALPSYRTVDDRVFDAARRHHHALGAARQVVAALTAM